MNIQLYMKLIEATTMQPSNAEGKLDMGFYWVACMAGEVGEVLNEEKKRVHREAVDEGAFRDKIMDELGDVFWYFVAYATSRGITLDEIVAYNTKKLSERYPNGFTKSS